MEKDFVCGMVVAKKKAGKSTYLGRIYYFCSPACKQHFDNSPANYLSGCAQRIM